MGIAWEMLEMQNLRPHSTPAESESALLKSAADAQVIHMHIK